jgi:serine/threonine protein kinase
VDFEYRPSIFNAFLYLEYCREGDLGQYLTPDGAKLLSSRQLLEIMQQISSALVYIHYGVSITVNSDGSTGDPEAVESKYDWDVTENQKFVIHRDIKPQNSKGTEYESYIGKLTF